MLGAEASARVHDSMFYYCQLTDSGEELEVEAEVEVELMDEE